MSNWVTFTTTLIINVLRKKGMNHGNDKST